MYIPTNSVNLKDAAQLPIRLALQGASGTGKTYSALTFPNPVVLDFDGNLNAHRGKNIIQVPFTSDEFVDSLAKRTTTTGPKSRPNRRDALKNWLATEALQLTAEQTLIIDSWTTLQDAFDMQQDLEPAYTKTGGIDEFAFWADKQDFSKLILNGLKRLKCHSVITFHEMYITDDSGKIIAGKIAPLMQGKFVNKLGLYFTDWFRCIVPSVGVYKWQTSSDAITNCKTRMANAPQFIEPHFKSFNY